MSTSNYPAGITQRDITALCPPDNTTPNREDCVGCHREIEQDVDTGWWFITEDFPMWKPTHRCDFTLAFKTDEGWWCGKDCFNELAIEVVEPKPFPLKAGAA